MSIIKTEILCSNCKNDLFELSFNLENFSQYADISNINPNHFSLKNIRYTGEMGDDGGSCSVQGVCLVCSKDIDILLEGGGHVHNDCVIDDVSIKEKIINESKS